MAVTIGQIHGMMLEEALLYLLEISGYRTVESAVDNGLPDPTLQDGHSGLEILGRGGVHQIDAVADLAIAQSFSPPQRLLLEAQFRSQKTGLEAVRNAIGILKDVSEYWVYTDKVPPKARYQYQYAIFSTSDYTPLAQKYAYAHNIHLIPLARSAFFLPVLKKIQVLNINSFNAPITAKLFSQLRRSIRDRIRGSETETLRQLVLKQALPLMDDFSRECRWLNGVLLGMMGRQFPILLVPHSKIRIDELKSKYKVELHWDKEGLYLRQSEGSRTLFSLDFPEVLFKLYAEQGSLSDMQAQSVKSNYLSEIQAVVMSNGEARVVTFELDRDWLGKYRDKLSQDEDEQKEDDR